MVYFYGEYLMFNFKAELGALLFTAAVFVLVIVEVGLA